ncbi:MAG TPA: type II secretion system F family protein [Smithellaceae bacterium]|jgi:type IV pilus assembly protein PilC|nr:type II secretion system F family protein [Syntrophaceae bacterium]NMC92745.1 type II secretion system F family protein [Smithella sp.]HNV57224.1 type II secretion system F family protein [Smithellaceae bacterium]MBP8665523.1 type II secretion system F family protein [Syntrophaceae bacterium]MBP9530764.1 type II secretion system F family protein [Syntrophaceae bacterium]
MPVFLWEGTTKKGEVKKGEMEAPDEPAVRTALRRQGFKSIAVKQKPKDLLENIPFLQGGVDEKNVVVFCRIFSTMIDAGLPLIQCLSILADQEENKAFAKILRTIKEDIEGGTSLTDALKKHPKVFDDLFVNLIAAGEAGGILDVVLARLSAYLENAMKLKAAVKSAMTYPITVLCIAAGVVTLLLLKVIPTFQKMFADMGGELPGPTQVVVGMSEFMQNYWWVLGVIVAAMVIGLKMFYKTEKGHWTIDALLLKAPLIGNVLRKVAVAKFTRTLATMMSSGVPILEGLNIVSKTAGNVVIEAAVVKTRQAISEGQSIAEPLSASGVFPPMVVQMIAVGEATGALDIMLNKIADFYDDEVDAAVKGMTAMIEPIMMVFLGGVCGGMIIAMYLPIFKMASVVG